MFVVVCDSGRQVIRRGRWRGGFPRRFRRQRGRCRLGLCDLDSFDLKKSLKIRGIAIQVLRLYGWKSASYPLQLRRMEIVAVVGIRPELAVHPRYPLVLGTPRSN